METSPRSALGTAAQSFCAAFAQHADIDQILRFFSTTHQITVVEHGEAALAPFLGRPFVGLPAVKAYFESISSLLSYENVKFSEFVVDVESSKVACKGQGKFTWLSTGESWDENFAYMIDFDSENKVTDYQVWADSGSAYLARVGKLDEVRKVRHSTGKGQTEFCLMSPGWEVGSSKSAAAAGSMIVTGSDKVE